MDSYGYVFDEEWMNLGSIFSCDQADSNQFTGHGLFSSEHGHGSNLETPIFCPISSNESNSSDSRDHVLSYPSDDLDLKYSKCYNDFSQESSSATDSPPQSCHDVFPFSLSKTHMDNVYDQSNDLLCVAEDNSSNFLLLTQIFSDDAMEEILCLKQDEVDVKGKKENSASQLMHIADRDRQTSLKRKYEISVELPNALEEADNTRKNNENPKKKTRVARDNKPKKKNQKKMMTVINSNEDDGDQESNIHDKNEKGRGNVQISSSCCSSEGDSQDVDGGATNNVTAKTRAGRGAATDPQSIYARKRRERINERLKILQTLVPNGTKVDISTMLEEAVHYVKFLQLQIKLLSSDDTWMYAPIAYNGMDMGLYQNISP